MSSSTSHTSAPCDRACSICRGPVHRPFFQLSEGFVCSSCLSRMSVGEMQRFVHSTELRGVLHF